MMACGMAAEPEHQWFTLVNPEDDDLFRDSILMTPLGGDRYRLEETPVFAVLDATVGDIIEAETIEDGELRFVAVVERTRWRTTKGSCISPFHEHPKHIAVVRDLEAMGCRWEVVCGGVVLLHAPGEDAYLKMMERLDRERDWLWLRGECRVAGALRPLKSMAQSVDLREQILPSGRRVHLQRWHIAFPPATPARLQRVDLPLTYLNKPLVTAYGEPMFGELAIVRHLCEDGWDAAWVDTFHGKLWGAMPQLSEPFDLSTAPRAHEVYQRIVEARDGKTGGFFDVMAWRDHRVLFVAYKGKGDRPNANENLWIDAALEAGVLETEMLLVAHP